MTTGYRGTLGIDVSADREIGALQIIVAEMEDLDDERVRRRIIRYLISRYIAAAVPQPEEPRP